MSQDIMLDIFDLGVEDTTPKKEEKKATIPTAQRQVKKPEPVLVQGDWTIHFATESFLVSDFVNEIPENGVSLEDVREGIERHFPKFSAARTRWEVDKKSKRLFPDAFAGSKGAIQLGEGRFAPSFFNSVEEALKSNQINRFVLSDTLEVFRVCKSPIGLMIAPSGDLTEEQYKQLRSNIGSLSKISPYFEWYLPKIPNSILQQIIQFFRAYVSDGEQYEVTLRVYYDLHKKEYIVDCPKQIVTPVYISFEQIEKYAGVNSQRYIPVLEVHSHNIMRAFFSETDNENEQSFNTSFGVFGVFGRLNRKEYESIFRAKFKESSVEFPIQAIFDFDDVNNFVDYPLVWHRNVETRKEFYL